MTQPIGGIRAAIGLVALALSARAEGIITTIAGGAKFQLTGIGGPAVNVPLGTIKSVAVDAQGNVYAVDASNFIVVKITPNGVLTAAAGNGTGGAEGDGGPAVNASFRSPKGLAVDASGNLFLSDGFRVRKVNPDGIITTVAGTDQGPHTGYSGEGGLATAASLSGPDGLAADGKGNLFIADGNRILKINAEGIISTVAGNGTCCELRDGVPANRTTVHLPSGLAVDARGNVYFSEDSRVRRVDMNGFINTIAGGPNAFAGDGELANTARLNAPNGIAVDAHGNVFIADGLDHRVRKINLNGIIHTAIGTGIPNYKGDEAPASVATLNQPTGIAIDANGNLYVGDSGNLRVRRVDPAGNIHAFAGNGNFGFAGEAILARQATLNRPGGVVVDTARNVYISDTRNHRVRRVSPDGVITTIAGGAAHGFTGDGGPATQALLDTPMGLALDGSGNLYIADTGNARVRRVDVNGMITTIAGGAPFLTGNGDGGQATNARLEFLRDLAFDVFGNLFVVDGFRIRRITPAGIISTFFREEINVPYAIAIDKAGNIYASEFPQAGGKGGNGPGLFRISADGNSSTRIGDFTSSQKIAIDAKGNLYIQNAAQVFRLAPDGTLTLIAGAAPQGFSGDDGPAELATLNSPEALAVDAAGNLYIADRDNNRIRKVFLNPNSGLFEPKLQITLQPGYYTVTASLGDGEQPGYWGMEILAPAGVFDGGLNLGGTIQRHSLPPGFGGFFLPSPQTARIRVDAQPAEGTDTTNVALGVRLLDVNRNPVAAERFGGASLDFTQALPAGYYTLEARGGENSPLEYFQVQVTAPILAGGVGAGGFAGPGTVGYAGFSLTAAQQVTIRTFGQPSYGAAGTGGLRLQVYDIKRNVIAAVP